MATEMTDAMIDGNIRGLYIMGENPVLSDPHMAHTMKALKSLDFLVVQDIFLTETARIADVVLPAASFAEKEGTFTNTERRVQRVRKAIPPPGEAMDDLSIICRLAGLMGYGMCATTPEEIFLEAASLWPAIEGMTYQRLKDGGLQWPCPTPDHPGTKYLFKKSFTRGKGLFKAVPYNLSSELPDADYPFILTTGRILFHYHTGTMTRRSKAAEAVASEPFIEISTEDAARLGVASGESVSVTSRRGTLRVNARVTGGIGRGVVFMPFHYHEAAANILTNDALDPVCKIPEAKVCAVRVEKL
jgi:predicted molibdopterin-dependent oxidoreductase YjgC